MVWAVLANNPAIPHNLNMPLTKIEEFLFQGNRAHFIEAFEFANGTITMRLTPVERNSESTLEETTATFSNASRPDVWKDASERDEWPLDIIGFDCYPHGKRWKFVLNCDTTEWNWESDWPSRTQN